MIHIQEINIGFYLGIFCLKPSNRFLRTQNKIKFESWPTKWSKPNSYHLCLCSVFSSLTTWPVFLSSLRSSAWENLHPSIHMAHSSLLWSLCSNDSSLNFSSLTTLSKFAPFLSFTQFYFYSWILSVPNSFMHACMHLTILCWAFVSAMFWEEVCGCNNKQARHRTCPQRTVSSREHRRKKYVLVI